MQILWHGGVHFARIFFTYTHALSQGCLWSHMLCFYTEIVYTETPLHRERRLFTRKHFYREMILRWERNACARRVFSYGHFHTDMLLNYFLWRTRFGAKSSASICKITVSPQLLMVEAHFVGKGWPRTNPPCNLTSMYDDRHFVRKACVSWTSINPRCPAARREKLETIKVVDVCKKFISTCVFTSATSHLNIPTFRFQKTISACIYISSALHLHMSYIRLVAVLTKVLCQPAPLNLHWNACQ